MEYHIIYLSRINITLFNIQYHLIKTLKNENDKNISIKFYINATFG
jgi:hypothetical protein